MNYRPKTIISDIDGVIFKHYGDITKQHLLDPSLLKGVKERWIDWDQKGYNIILITGRRESVRKETIEQLTKSGIFFDLLIMGVGGGPRIIINDKKENDTTETALAINLVRNEGLKNVDL